jgi:competence protein ComEC
VRAPAALLAIPLLLGCCVGLLVPNEPPTTLALIAAGGSSIVLFAAWSACADSDAAICAVCLVIASGVVGVSLGASAATRAYRSSLTAWYESQGSRVTTPIALRGVLRENASLTPLGVSLVLDVDAIGDCVGSPGAARGPCGRVAGGVRLSVGGTMAADAFEEWRADRTLAVTATLREPVTYRDPGVPDERRALARRGIVLVGSVKSSALVEGVAPGSFVSEAAAAARAWARHVVSSTVGPWSPRSAGIAAAIAIGDRTGLAQDDERRLQEAGTYHVIAISGGNIAIVTILLQLLLRAVGVPLRLACALTIAGLLFYGRITGSSASVDRAIAGAVIVLAGRLLDHRGSPLNVVAAVAVMGIAAAPVALFDPGFLLSFGATTAILIGAPRALARLEPWRRRSLPWRTVAAAAALFAATLSAEIALAPLTAALFGRVTFAGLLLNFAAIPLMTVVQGGTIAALALFPADQALARVCGYAAHLGAHSLVSSAQLVDLAPWLSREVVPPSWWLVASYYVAVVVALARRSMRLKASIAAASVGAVIIAGHHATSRDGVTLPDDRTLRIVFLDVGQGDATAVLMPGNRAFLIDAGGLPSAPLPLVDSPADGGGFDVGARVVTPALRAFGVRSLETFIITHGDPDHIGGAMSVMRSFRPREIWEGVPVPSHVPLQEIASAAIHVGAGWRTVRPDDRLRVGDVEITIWHPPLPDWERQRVRNDDSIVTAIRYGRVRIIVPGDVGREGETMAMRHIEHDEAVDVVVLKAAHHGSATSSVPEWLAATAPKAVVFSAGRQNRFGHPAPTVVSRYRAIGAAIFSTAEDGAVVLDTDGRSVRIEGWSSGKTWAATALQP